MDAFLSVTLVPYLTTSCFMNKGTGLTGAKYSIVSKLSIFFLMFSML